MFKLGFRTDAEGSFKKIENRTVRTPVVSHVPRRDMGAGRDHRSEKTTLKDINPMQGGDGTTPHTPLLDDLRERGNLKEWVGKIRGTKASLGSQDKVQTIDQTAPLVGMQWEIAHLQELDEVHVGALVPIKKLEAKVGGPTYVGSDLGPFAMCYVEEKGWIAETLGPSSKDWKRLARKVKPKSNNEGKSPIKVKREGPTPLQELDPNIKNFHDISNSIQVFENNDGAAQAKWKRLPRMEVGTSSISAGLVGSKRPMDMASELNELLSKQCWLLIWIKKINLFWRWLDPSLARSNELRNLDLQGQLAVQELVVVV